MVRPRLSAALPLVLIAAAGLRFFGLDRESLWTDEGASIYYAHTLNAAFEDANPPLYYLILHFWTAALGTSEIALRSLSAVFGLATVFVCYQFATDLLGRRAALYIAALVSLSTLQIYYDQEARAYALFALTGVASMWALVRFLQRPQRAQMLVYAVTSSLLLYVHPYAVFLVASQWVFVGLALAFRQIDQSLISPWLLSQAILLAALAPWAAIILLRGRLQPGYPLPPISLGMLKETLLEYANGSRLLGYLGLGLVGSVLAFDAIRGKRSQTKWLSPIWVDVLLLTWILGTIAFAGVVSLLGPSIFYPRYTLAASLGFYFLLGRALDAIRPIWLSLTGAVVLTIAMAVTLPAYYSQVQKEQWREVAAIIDSQAEPNALVAFDGLPASVVFDLYSHRTDLDKVELPSGDDAAAALAKWSASRRDTWLVHLHSAAPLESRSNTFETSKTVQSWSLVGIDLRRLQ